MKKIIGLKIPLWVVILLLGIMGFAGSYFGKTEEVVHFQKMEVRIPVPQPPKIEQQIVYREAKVERDTITVEIPAGTVVGDGGPLRIRVGRDRRSDYDFDYSSAYVPPDSVEYIDFSSINSTTSTSRPVDSAWIRLFAYTGVRADFSTPLSRHEYDRWLQGGIGAESRRIGRLSLGMDIGWWQGWNAGLTAKVWL